LIRNPRSDLVCFSGYLRPDGLVGARNKLAIIYTIDYAKFVASEIANKIPDSVPLGWSSARRTRRNEDVNTIVGLGRNPNLGAILLIGQDNSVIPVSKIADGISKSGKPVEIIDLSAVGGSKEAIRKGLTLSKKLSAGQSRTRRTAHDVSNLTIGVKCGGSDATSALAANPAVGLVSDKVIDCGGKVLSSELTEMTGCEEMIRRRARNQRVAAKVIDTIEAAVDEFESRFGEEHSMMSPGNISGGLTTIEEKSFGAVMKTGHRQLQGLIGPGAYPKKSGWYIVDGLVAKSIRHFGLEADGEPTDFAAAGAQLTLFTTGRGSADGNGVSPLVKVCGNPQTYRNMSEDMDFNAGAILEGKISLQEAGSSLFKLVLEIASGSRSKSELLGHDEGGIIYGGRPTLIIEQ